jgi:hypothetical protein
MASASPAASVARPYRWWMPSERQIVARHYPIGGAKAVASLLPHRSLISIYGEAARLGLKRPCGRGRKARG